MKLEEIVKSVQPAGSIWGMDGKTLHTYRLLWWRGEE